MLAKPKLIIINKKKYFLSVQSDITEQKFAEKLQIERKQDIKETITTLKIKFFTKMPKILFEL